ncbi:neurotransmitter-gated ion-channel transmembrane region domain-containing protein [Ditylenchus destructor]|nr:neurotransmitter-gated ion-channel transmembrane region domain-containing protein [Ditylenchus destructor]
MSLELLFILYRCILSVKPSIIFRFRILNLLLWCLQDGVVLGQIRSERDDFSIKHSANTVKPRKDFTTVKNYAYEKFGQVQELSSSSTGWGYGALENEAPTQNFIEDPKKRKMALQGKLYNKYTDFSMPEAVTVPNNQSSREYDDWRDPNDFDQITAHRRLVDELLDPEFYERTVHPRRNFHEPTRINLIYNSESLEQKRTEALMNAIVTTGYWNNDTRGAAIQLMFPAIYKLSCKMNVRFFPYDQQEEWEVITFEFVRVEQMYKCCAEPWVMLYAQLVIRRKPLYYIINLVIPTSIITIVALLTMSIMMLMVCNQMPSTSSYVPLMSWYYMGIIFVIVIGTLMATIVLFVHSRKTYCRPLPTILRNIAMNKIVWVIILEPPATLLELWTEYGLINETRVDADKLDPILLEKMGANKEPANPMIFLSSISSRVSAASAYHYERRLASVTKQYAQQVRERERKDRKRRETLQDAVEFLTQGSTQPAGHNNSRVVKKQKMMRRSALEWEYLASIIDRCLLSIFSLITIAFFVLLVFFDSLFEIEHQILGD